MIAPGQRAGWQFTHLLDAPHRLAFSAATLLLVVSAAWWATVIVLGGHGVALRWSLPPAIAHGVLMSFGFMPLFFIGFLFTAGPKWLQRPDVDARTLVEPLLAMLSGWAVFGLSLHGRDADFGHTLGAIGIGAVAVGWFGIVRRFMALLRASRATDRVHIRLVAAGCVYGLAALGVVAVGLATGAESLVRAATVSALWACIGLVFCAVAHRMVPFFSGAALPALEAWRPTWLLAAFVSLCALEAGAAAVNALGWTLPAAVAAALALVEISTGLGLLAMAVLELRSPSLKLRLPTMLHIGFSWLALAVLLSGVSRALGVASASWSLGLAPLHAYTMGFLGSMMLAMVTRVTCGQSGRVVVADDVLWGLFWVLQLATLARIGAALLVAVDPVWALALLAAAAIGWAGVCLSWAGRYGRWFGLARGAVASRP